jgi:hypothetical protein
MLNTKTMKSGETTIARERFCQTRPLLGNSLVKRSRGAIEMLCF